MGLDSVELVIAWEKEFSISIPNELAATLITPQIAAEAIEEILLSEGRAWDRELIERIIKETTLEISGLDPGDYDASSEFVRDMGLD